MRPNLVINGIDFNQRLDDAAIFIDLSIDLIFTREKYVKETLEMFMLTGMLIKLSPLTIESIFDKKSTINI
jgi:hypothetical protein